MQRFCWALWNQLMIQQKCNGYCVVAEKKCELATKMKASNLSLQYLQALFYFAITSIQATSFFVFGVVVEEELQWTGQSKEKQPQLCPSLCVTELHSRFLLVAFFILFPLMRV